MDERYQIQMREASSKNPPELLDRIKDAIDELFDYSVSAAGNYVKGKSEQETAKAAEIKAKALSHLANLDFERQRLLAERDKLLREDRQKMYELKTKRLEAICQHLIKLKEMGAKVEIEIITTVLVEAMNESIQ